LAASVVGRFEDTIEKVVALAVLMPIVAGMGGNAGTQVLALMVRGLALGQVGASNAKVLLWKEVRVALLNGLALGALLAGVVWLWFDDIALSLVIYAALIMNLLFASLAGVLVPLTLRRLGFDPALASGIFLTTVTDVMGFFVFLGLGSLILLH
jgi:magnesium transporter